MTDSTIINQEVDKFAEHRNSWWDQKGPLKTLHDINPARLQFICQQLNLRGKTVLDVGCGGGILAEAMAKSGANVTGIDVGADAILVAEDHAQKSKLIIDYQCTAIEEYKPVDGFDVITCMELLEHVNKPELVLEHCRRLLKPSGFLFLSTINRTVKAYATAIIAAEYILGILPKQTHDYNKFIKPSELNNIALALDLKLIDLQGMHYNPWQAQAYLCKDVGVNYLMAFNL